MRAGDSVHKGRRFRRCTCDAETEKIASLPQRGGHAVYSLLITRSRRATALRQDNFMRFLTVEPDHASTYGKK
jgi:hypothetical protein